MILALIIQDRLKWPRFSSDIIEFAVWAYYKLSLSLRDVEDLLAQRGIEVSRESIQNWCRKFGRIYQMRLRSKAEAYGDTWFLDEVFINIKVLKVTGFDENKNGCARPVIP